MARPVIVWFRRDLRVDDHAALYHASRLGLPVIPLFIVDRPLIDRLPSDGAAFDFQAEALRDLAAQLGKLGGRLTIREGSATAVHEELLREVQPTALYFNRDYEPSAQERDAGVERLYRAHGVEVVSFKDAVIHEPSELLTGRGDPYVVFTPYANAWKRLSHPAPFGMPQRMSTPSLSTSPIPDARSLGRRVRIGAPAVRGGSTEALRRWKTFLKGPAAGYETGRNLPGRAGTSRMSPHLRFGTISIRRMLEDCSALAARAPESRTGSIDKFVDELIWREFYQAVLWHDPGLAVNSYRRWIDRFPWSRSRRTLEAWKEGRTGFPIVDAGMRELTTTGWMHNRVRMVVASFLTKDLRHDWRTGERAFAEYLLDIETASNNGGWQWSASAGVDPKPLRIFNPRRQSERFDPDGAYIRTFVPELRNVPAPFIHAPHEMPSTLQREVGCVIGRDYPVPIVDHAEASAAFKRIYAELSRSGCGTAGRSLS